MDQDQIRAKNDRIYKFVNSSLRIDFSGGVERDNFAMMMMETGIDRRDFFISGRSIFFLKPELYAAAMIMK